MEEKSNVKTFHSRFGYIMVAAGAVIGLGNVWKFPYLAYGGGGGAFIFVYLIFAVIIGIPMVEMETAIGRYAKENVVNSYGAINKKWKFAGFINGLAAFLIDMYYIIVSGYVLKYALVFIFSGDFSSDKEAYYLDFISDPIEPLIYAAVLMIIVIILLAKGITETVEKVTKVLIPAMFIFLLVCGVWALFVMDGAIEGLKFYLIPDFSQLTLKTCADACMQVIFSVGVGWGIYTTLGANVSDDADIKSDSVMVTICDTAIALMAGFVIIPSVVGSGTDMAAGPSLVFLAMTDVFDAFPIGRIFGSVFFAALCIAVLSTWFTILEVPAKFVQEKFNLSHTAALCITGGLIMIGGVICSLSQGYGLLSDVTLPWWSFSSGVCYYNFYDWLDCFTGYVLLPLACLLTAFYCCKIWGFKGYEAELIKNDPSKKLTMYNKICMAVIVPLGTIFVILDAFGFIQ